MFRGLLLRTFTTLLFASLFLSVSWAQDKDQPPTPPPYLSGAEITSQLNYSCPSNTACSFICPGGVGGGADHVTKLTIYLGTMPLSNDQNAPAMTPHRVNLPLWTELAVVSGHRPVLLHRWVWRHAEAIDLASVEAVAVLVSDRDRIELALRPDA